MGQPKLSRDAAESGERNLTGVLEDPKPIAQRFAYSMDLRQSALHLADPPPISQRPEPPSQASGVRTGWLLRLRFQLAALIPVALIVCLAAGALWLSPDAGTTTSAAVAEPQAETLAVLTTPERIEARAGEQVSFPIALDGTDGVPPRSAIAIAGLPGGSNLSEGRPYGKREWSLRPDQIGDLSVVLPPDASGEFKLEIGLVAPDGKLVAESETLLKVAPASAGETVEEGSAPLLAASPAPEGDAAAPATAPDAEQEAALAPIPQEGQSEGAMPERTAIVADEPTPSDNPPADELEQSADLAAVPSGAARPPSTVGHAANEAKGLGTVRPSEFVNLREAPSSSAPVLGVIAKGAELAVLDRKRGWIQVADPATAKKGWVYSGNIAGEAKPQHRRISRVAPPDSELKSESFWRRLENWLRPWKEN